MDDRPSLSQIIYVSALDPAVGPTELLLLLQRARVFNEQRQITGILVEVEGSILQVLEGEPETISALFDRISADPRHLRVLKLIQEPVEARSFGDWSMGLAEMSRADIAALPGMNDFFKGGRSLADLAPGRARQVLSGFRRGMWHARVDSGAVVAR